MRGELGAFVVFEEVFEHHGDVPADDVVVGAFEDFRGGAGGGEGDDDAVEGHVEGEGVLQARAGVGGL